MSPATDDGKTPLIIESQDGYDTVGRKLRRTIIHVSAVCLLILVVAGALCGIILAITSKPDSTTNVTTISSTAAPDTYDCQWSAWSQWRPCSQSCQGGQQLRTRIVTRHQVGDGQPCEGGHEESRRCNTWPCPGLVDCSGGEKSLNEAADKGNVTEVQGLIGCRGMDINYADSYGQTSLLNAALEGHLEVVQLLLSTPGIEPNKAEPSEGLTPLFGASQEGHVDVVRELLSHPKTDPNQALTHDSFFTKEGATPLLAASVKGNDAVVKELLSHPQTDPNQADKWGATPLWVASEKGHEAVVRELLSHPQTDPNHALTGPEGLDLGPEGLELGPDVVLIGATPLWIASGGGPYGAHAGVVRELLSHSQTDPNQARTTDGATPLFIASWEGHVDVVRELLKDPRVNVNKASNDKGVNPNVPADWHVADLTINAIGAAAFEGRLEVVKLLLRCPKVKLGVKDKDGKTELDHAKEKGHKDIVNAIQSRQTLLEQGNTC